MDRNHTKFSTPRTRPMTRDEVIATQGIEARCFYKVRVGDTFGPAAPWPRVSVGPAGVREVAKLVAARTQRIRR
jgi:hypothetical protein